MIEWHNPSLGTAKNRVPPRIIALAASFVRPRFHAIRSTPALQLRQKARIRPPGGAMKRAIRDPATCWRGSTCRASCCLPRRRSRAVPGVCAAGVPVADGARQPARPPATASVAAGRGNCRSPRGFREDAVGDLAAELTPGLVRKYQSRALLIASGACAVNCRYCFRRHYPYSEAPKSIASGNRR